APVSGNVRTHYFTPDGRARPGKTPVRTAVSPRLLIRMRSQVQVLAGPPPNPQVTALPAASQERPPSAWAAPGPPPSPPGQPIGPLRPVHPDGRRHNHHSPWSPTQPRGRQPRGRRGHLARQPAPVPTAPPQRPPSQACSAVDRAARRRGSPPRSRRFLW